MGGGGQQGCETQGGASGSGLGICAVCARPQPKPCPAWLCSRPCQPARHALFCGFQVDRLRGNHPRPREAGGGGVCHPSHGSFTCSCLPRPRLAPGGSVCCGLSSSPRPFLSPLQPLLLPPPPSCSAWVAAALWCLRAVFLLSLTAPGQGPGGGSIAGLPSGDERHQMASFPFSAPESGSLPRVISRTSCEHSTVVQTPDTIEGNRPGGGGQAQMASILPTPRATVLLGLRSDVSGSSLFFLFYQLSLEAGQDQAT